MKRVAALFVLAVACSDLPTPYPRVAAGITPAVPTGMQYFQGLVGTPLTQTPRVRVFDFDGQPMDGVTVNFTLPNGGSVAAASAVSENGGYASPGEWTLGTTAGTQSLMASLDGSPDIFTVFTAQAISFGKAAAGDAHSCATSSTGTGYCWGMNAFFQSGGPLTADRLTAQAGGGGGSSLVAGAFHSCGLSASGIAACWGRNNSGQLGINSTVDRSFSLPPNGNLSFRSISAGAEHTCGVTTQGDAYCWGLNSKGQIGDSTTTTRLVPTAVKGGIKFTQIAAGGNHTCAIAVAGPTYCWGENLNGGVGDGTTTDRIAPILVSASGVMFANLALGSLHSCGIEQSGTVYCWGLNSSGQLGDGTTTDRLTPAAVVSTQSFRILAAGGNRTCATAAPNDVAFCWGSNSNGQLGDGTTTNRSSPTAVSGGHSFASLAAGTLHTCGTTLTGRAYCWGSNANGRLGDGTTVQRLTPQAVRLQ